MNDNVQTLDAHAAAQAAELADNERRAEEARRNSERMPRFAAWLATVRAFDPKARVLWAMDGDQTAGRVPEGLRHAD